jgi:hypothetical protein
MAYWTTLLEHAKPTITEPDSEITAALRQEVKPK